MPDSKGKSDHYLENVAMEEVRVEGLSHDAFTQWEEIQFVLATGMFELPPRRTYEEEVRHNEFLSEEMKERIIAESDGRKMADFNALVKEFNEHLEEIRAQKSKAALTDFLSRARALRRRPK